MLCKIEFAQNKWWTLYIHEPEALTNSYYNRKANML